MSKSFYLSLGLLAFMLLACVGLQSPMLSTPTPNYALTTTFNAEQAAPSQTAYANSLPTFSAEEGQAIRETQVQLIETRHAAMTAYAILNTEVSLNSTADAEALAQGTNPYPITATADVPRQTATAEFYLTQHASFSLTATQIVASATAWALITPDTTSPMPIRSASSACPIYAWTQVDLRYRQNPEEDWTNQAEITEFIYSYCSNPYEIFFSHEILIQPERVNQLNHQRLYQVLENAISHLRDYPPQRPDISELVHLQLDDKGQMTIGIFSYSEVLAAYDSGLRGAELAEALHLNMPWEPAP